MAFVKFSNLSPLRQVHRLIVKAFKEQKLPWTTGHFRRVADDGSVSYCAIGGAHMASATGQYSGPWSLTDTIVGKPWLHGYANVEKWHTLRSQLDAIVTINDTCKTKGEMLRKVRAYVNEQEQNHG